MPDTIPGDHPLAGTVVDPSSLTDTAPVIFADGTKQNLSITQEMVVSEMADGGTVKKTAKKFGVHEKELRKVLRDRAVVQAIFETAARRMRSEAIPLALNSLIEIIGAGSKSKTVSTSNKLTAIRTLLTYSAAMENIISKTSAGGHKSIAEMSAAELDEHVSNIKTKIADIEGTAVDVTPKAVQESP